MKGEPGRGVRRARLAVGCMMLILLFLVLAYGSPPAGITGEVVRNNRNKGIDATPFFYTEAEGIPQAGKELKAVVQRRTETQ